MFLSRRRFLGTTALTAAVAGLGGATPAFAAPARTIAPGLQLYSVKDELAQDYAGTLRRIAAIGYRTVELAGLPPRSAASVRAELRSAGLQCTSVHVDLPTLLADSERSIAYVRELGASHLICPAPWVADASRLRTDGGFIEGFIALMGSFTLDDWRWNAAALNRIGGLCQRAGLRFGYHNHGFEFRRFGDTRAFDELLRLTDPQLVAIELDCGWAVNAGVNPTELLARYPGRIQLLHIKDLRAGVKPSGAFGMATTAVGSGIIDWRKVLGAAQAAGVRDYFVELEPPYTQPPLDAAKISYDYLRTLQL